MSGLFSGVGLISGLDYQSIVDQLIAIDGRPRDLLLARMGTIDAQRTAYLDVSARITALLSRVDFLTNSSSFQATTASSSLPDVLSVTTGAGAQPGAYNFVVRALAATHQAVSRGYASRSTPLTPGTLTIESAQARVNRATQLSQLNGHTGVQRGSFRITDANGDSAVISTTDALTLGEVLDEINTAGIAVRAEVRGDGLVLTDTSGGGSETLRVEELNGGQAAGSLGFGPGYRLDSDLDGELVGSGVMYLAQTTPLSALNDGLGVRALIAGGDFTIKAGAHEDLISVDLGAIIKGETRLERLNHGQGVRLGRIKITSKDGTFTEVDLSDVRDIAQVREAIEGAFGDSRLNVIMTGSGLMVTDGTTVDDDDEAHAFVIEDLDGHAARDLGIDGSSNAGKINGRDILHVDTLADVITAINYAVGNEDPVTKEPLVVASVAADGHGLTLESRTSGALIIESSDDAHALADLGFTPGTYVDVGGGAFVTGSRIVGGLNTSLLKTLNGGAGFDPGTVQIDANGSSATVDLSGAETLADVVRLLREAADDSDLGIDVGYDSTGTRLELVNQDGGSTPITFTDVSGDFAAATGLTEQVGGSIRSDNLQRRYVSENTLLADLNAGQGVSLGKFTITSSMGLSDTVDLSFSSDQTLQDVITAINNLSINVEARINDTGDGLIIIDNAGGPQGLKIEDDGGTAARDLNIAGEADEGSIDGSYEFELELGISDTLETVASRISADTTLASGTLLNDGTGLAPYRLSITSRVSGAAGELIIDDNTGDLGIATLTQAQDARVLFGSSADSGILITSADNTFDGVIDGLTFTVSSVSDDPVTVTVAHDIDGLIENIQGLVDAYNEAWDRIGEVSDYDAETETAGVLLGEGTLRIIENRLFRMFSGTTTGVGGPFQRLSEVGIQFTSGSRLSFDEDEFREAYQADPTGVTSFFSDKDNGVAQQIKEGLESITNDQGLIPRQTETLAGHKELLEDRVERLNELLDRKRARMLREFQAMESALALMQSQQAALSSLSAMAQSAGTASAS